METTNSEEAETMQEADFLLKKKTHKMITVLRETSRCVYVKQEQYVF